MWVPKTPRRSDFCGMPPCPLCYDYVGGNDMGHEVKTDGKVKMAQDMLGRKPTPTEQKVIDESAEKIHIGNLSQKQVDEADLVEAEIKDMTQVIERSLAYKRKADSIPKRKPRQKTLDELDVEKIVKKQKKAEKKKEQKEYDPYNAYEQQLRQMEQARQMQNAYAYEYAGAKPGQVIPTDKSGRIYRKDGWK